MITVITGLPGTGKTYMMSEILIQGMKRRQPAFVNYKLAGGMFWENILDLLHVRHGNIGIDEGSEYLDAERMHQIPKEVKMLWTQARKNSTNLFVTAQDFTQLAKPFRRIVNYVWINDFMFTDNVDSVWSKVWVCKLYKASDVEKGRTRDKYILKKKIVVGVSKKWNLYDTYMRITKANYFGKIETTEAKDFKQFDSNLSLKHYEDVRADLPNPGLVESQESLHLGLPELRKDQEVWKPKRHRPFVQEVRTGKIRSSRQKQKHLLVRMGLR